MCGHVIRAVSAVRFGFCLLPGPEPVPEGKSPALPPGAAVVRFAIVAIIILICKLRAAFK